MILEYWKGIGEFMKFNLPEIKQGMKLKCLNCGKPVLISDETFKMDAICEYIECPSCTSSYNVQAYHIYGEELNNYILGGIKNE